MSERSSSRMMRRLVAILTVIMMIAAVVMQAVTPLQAFADEAVSSFTTDQVSSGQPNASASESDADDANVQVPEADAADGTSTIGSGASSNGNTGVQSDTIPGNENAQSNESGTTPQSNSGTESAGTSKNESSTDAGDASVTPVVPSTGTITVAGNIVKHTDVPYTAPWSATQTQKLDVYGPASETLAQEGTSAATAKPVVVFIHGGAWINGDKSFLNSRMPLVNTLLQSGYLVASINYRLASESPWPAQINDTKSAVRFLRANASKYGIDPDRIAVFGESAGAHLAQLMGVTKGSTVFVDAQDGNGSDVSSDVQAVISDFGISDVDAWGKLSGDDTVSAAYAKNLLFGAKQSGQYTAEQARAASPLTYVSADAAPMMLAHGQNDRTVSYRQTVLMEQALTKAGVAVSAWYPVNGPHSSADVFCTNITAQQKYLDFLSSVLTTEQNGQDGTVTDGTETIPVYRFYNAAEHTHLFSSRSNEITVLEQEWTGWNKERIAFRVLPEKQTSTPSAASLYGRGENASADSSSSASSAVETVTRMHNAATGDYVYTSSTAEIESLQAAGWAPETSFRVPTHGGIPVYRLYNATIGRHMLTADSAERDKLIAQGWRSESIPFHAYAADQITVGAPSSALRN